MVCRLSARVFPHLAHLDFAEQRLRGMLGARNLESNSRSVYTAFSLRKRLFVGAYMVFTTSSMLYFVKESSHARLGIGQAEPRRNWVFAVIKSIETCQIRKDKNR